MRNRGRLNMKQDRKHKGRDTPTAVESRAFPAVSMIDQ
jgi:hypothetical protein